MKYLLVLSHIPSTCGVGKGTVASDDEAADSICVGVGTHCTDWDIGPCEGVGDGTVSKEWMNMSYIMKAKVDHINNLLLWNSIYLLSSWDDGGGGEGGVASDFSPEDLRLDIGMRGITWIKDNYADSIW